MNDPETCEHDFRRLYAASLRGTPDTNGPVLSVLCCGCGQSPIALVRAGQSPDINVKGDWPIDKRVKDFLVDDMGVASVVF